MTTQPSRGAIGRTRRPTRKIYVPSLIAYVQRRINSSHVDPAALNILGGKLVCSPKEAAHILDCGITKLYELIASNEIESYAEIRRDTAA